MRRDEFNTQVGGYVGKLWPKAEPMSPEEVEVWFHRLQHYHVTEVRAALGTCKATSRYAPALSEILAALREERKTHGGKPASGPAFSAADMEAKAREEIAEEKARIAADLDAYSAEDLEDFKGQILAHEPGYTHAQRLPVTAQVWQDAIWDRFVHDRVWVPIFDEHGKPAFEDREINGVTIRSAGYRKCRLMNREEYWALLEQQKQAESDPEMAESLAMALRQGV